MEPDVTTKQQADDASSTLDEIKALAPLSEEWWLAASRQLAAGKRVLSSEWKLSKHAFTVGLFLGLCLVAMLTTLFIALNIFAAYGLFQADLQVWAVGVVLIALDIMLIVLLIKTMKRVFTHVNMSSSWAMLKGENSLLSEEKDNE